MFSLQFVGGGLVDPDMLRRVFHSQQVPPAGFNRGFYTNPVVDQLIDRATVATDEAELPRLAALEQRGLANGLAVSRVTAAEVREHEPEVRAIAALHVPETGIIDYRAVCAVLVRRLGGSFTTVSAFDCATAPLPAFAPARGFVF